MEENDGIQGDREGMAMSRDVVAVFGRKFMNRNSVVEWAAYCLSKIVEMTNT